MAGRAEAQGAQPLQHPEVHPALPRQLGVQARGPSREEAAWEQHWPHIPDLPRALADGMLGPRCLWEGKRSVPGTVRSPSPLQNDKLTEKRGNQAQRCCKKTCIIISAEQKAKLGFGDATWCGWSPLQRWQAHVYPTVSHELLPEGSQCNFILILRQNNRFSLTFPSQVTPPVAPALLFM